MLAPDQSSLAFEPFSLAELSGRLRHNARREPADEHIDRQRTVGNRALFGDSVTEDNGRQTVLSLTGLHRLRKNARLHEIVVQGTARMQHTETERDEWCRDVMGFAKKRVFGAVMRADLHLDESTPHIHLIIVPTGESGLPDVPEKWRRAVWGGGKKFYRSRATKRRPRADAGRLCGGRLRRGYLYFLQEFYADVMQFHDVEPRTRNAGVPQVRRQQFADAVNAPMPAIRVQPEDIPDPPFLGMVKATENYKKQTALHIQTRLEIIGLKTLADQARNSKLLEIRDRDRKAKIEQANAQVQKAERNLREANERIAALQSALTNERSAAEASRSEAEKIRGILVQLEAARKLPGDRDILRACGVRVPVQGGVVVTPSGAKLRVAGDEVFTTGNAPGQKSGLEVIAVTLGYTPSDAVAFAAEVFDPEVAAKLHVQNIAALRRIPPPPPPREDVAQGVAELGIPADRRISAGKYLASPLHYLDGANNFVLIKRSFSGNQQGWISFDGHTPGITSPISIGAGCAWSGQPRSGKIYVVRTPHDFIKGRRLAEEGLLICDESGAGYIADLAAQRSATSVTFCNFNFEHPSVQEFRQCLGSNPELISFQDALRRTDATLSPPEWPRTEADLGYSRIVGPDSFGI